MQFNIINNNKYEIIINEKSNISRKKSVGRFEEILYDEKNEYSKLTAKEIIKKINKSGIYNFESRQKINIKYEDFTYLDKITLTIRDFIKRTKTLSAQYDYENKLVSIKEELLDNKTSRFKNITDKNFFLNFVLLHEIGHAIQCSLADNDKQLDPSLLKLGTINETRYPQYISKLPTIIAENFADIYATCAIIILDKDNSNLMNNLQEILNDRIKHSEIDMYYSFNAIKDILDNITIVDNFNQFKDLVDYIEKQTKKELKIHIEKELHVSRGEMHILNALGYFHSIFTPDCKNDKDIKEYLKNNFDISIPHYTYDSTYFFEYKKNQNEEPSKKLKKKIFSIREQTVTSTYKNNNL